MARGGLPNPMARRQLLERELSADHAVRVAEAYLAEDRCGEAVAFLAKAKDAERLQKLRRTAIDQGDAFLLKEVTRALKERATAEEWRVLGQSAEATGKQRYAAQAQRQAEREEA